jgi:hypothetical protein
VDLPHVALLRREALAWSSVRRQVSASVQRSVPSAALWVQPLPVPERPVCLALVSAAVSAVVPASQLVCPFSLKTLPIWGGGVAASVKPDIPPAHSRVLGYFRCHRTSRPTLRQFIDRRWHPILCLPSHLRQTGYRKGFSVP